MPNSAAEHLLLHRDGGLSDLETEANKDEISRGLALWKKFALLLQSSLVNVKFVSLLAAVSVFVYSCKKDTTTPDPTQHLVKIIDESSDSIAYTFFNYDESERLVSIKDSNNNGNVSETFIQYNAQNQPVKFRSDSLLYNENNQVIKRLWFSNVSNRYKTLATYNYDEKNRLVADTVYDYWTDDLYGYTIFTYDGNDNITQWQSFHDLSGVMHSDGVITASYNSSLNPYSTLGAFTYFIRGDNGLLSRNNYLEVKYYDGRTIDYAYEYYDNGLPEKIVQTDSRVGSFSVHNIEFFYN